MGAHGRAVPGGFSVEGPLQMLPGDSVRVLSLSGGFRATSCFPISVGEAVGVGRGGVAPRRSP